MLRTYNIDEDDVDLVLTTETPTTTKSETTFVTLMEKAVTPEKFSGFNMPVDEWLQLYTLTCKANEYTDDKTKIAKAIKCMEGNALRWYVNWAEENSDNSLKWKDFADALKQHFPSNLSNINKKMTANNRVQRDGESFAEYAADKLHLIKKACPDADQADKITMLLEGTQDKMLEELIKEDYDTVDDLILQATKISENKALIARRRRSAGNFEFNAIAEALDNVKRSEFRNNYQSNFHGRGQFRGRGSFRGRNQSFNGPRRQFFPRSNSRPNSTPPSRSTSPFRNSRVQCHGCRKFGHVVSNCRANRNVRFNLNRN